MGFHLDECSCLRQLDHASIDDVIERRKQWRELSQLRFTPGQPFHGYMRKKHPKITQKTVDDLHTLADVLLNNSCEFKLVVGSNQGYVYTNDTGLIDTLSSMKQLSCKTYARALVTRPKNTIKLKNSCHKFRSYFKLTQLSIRQKDNLMDFLYNQRYHVRVSPALQRWIDQPFIRTQDYFFVDHDTETWLTMLNLVQPGIVRKTMQIIADK